MTHDAVCLNALAVSRAQTFEAGAGGWRSRRPVATAWVRYRVAT